MFGTEVSKGKFPLTTPPCAIPSTGPRKSVACHMLIHVVPNTDFTMFLTWTCASSPKTTTTASSNVKHHQRAANLHLSFSTAQPNNLGTQKPLALCSTREKGATAQSVGDTFHLGTSCRQVCSLSLCWVCRSSF